MNLLLRRSQVLNNVRRGHFSLWAMVEPTDEEAQLIKRYNMHTVELITVPQPYLRLYSIICGLVCAIALILAVLAAPYSFRVQAPLYVWVALAVAGGALAGFTFYTQYRETIFVKDLLHGRRFKCRSVIELARKEAYLESITNYFRQVVESAKHWGGTQTVPIEPLPPEEAKRFILSGPLL